MTGKPELLMPSTEHCIVWTVRERDVGLGALSGYRSAVKRLYIDQGVDLPEPYDNDMKVI
ncbi:hypothetical protein H310_04735 [Aphanomyces invadans]|uniref:Uncharacterized protein n=1 Tax=Aphanomyces invadans TaxID=157072 RepID=A0A024UDJ5_9STRA|nr:hypothetical protein H310_04735 [Aphanomyces invadans]ETW04461.1 hypothetical protein H310_04735 [Aphanomyces invadans]|eukprot:XP_008867417.1 hypothetical protein H310_04735 [Aphanomyces invadans]